MKSKKRNSMYKTEIEKALKSKQPIDELRILSLKLNKEGYNSQEIYNILYEYDLELIKEGRQDDSYVLEDVMDMVTGYYSGYNLNLE